MAASDVQRAAEDAPKIGENCLLIGGTWVPPAEGGTITVTDPGTGEAIQGVGRGTAKDIDDAVSAARAAFPDWAGASPSQRGQILGRWAQLVFGNVEELARLEAQEIGKPLSEARTNMYIAASIVQYDAGGADRLLGATLPSRNPGRFGFTLREPHGVCAVLIPWNVPAILMTARVTAALAAGNTVVLKPSEFAPLVSLRLAELALEAGLPSGALNVVTGYGPEAGMALTSHAGVNHISFTGSAATGSSVMTSAAKNLIPVHLELGGKSPNIVLEDADLESALPMIVNSITQNAGQNCYAGSRLLVQSSIASEAVEAVTRMMGEVRVGLWHEDLDMGPLINEQQFKKVMSYIDTGREEGARIALGGSSPGDSRLAGGYFVEPTVFTEARSDMTIAREEIFGPVLSVIEFADVDDAIKIANDTPYGLLAAVWTRDLGRAHRLIEELDAGQITVNEFANSSIIGFPFASRKASGFQAAGGYEAMREFTKEKAVSLKFD